MTLNSYEKVFQSDLMRVPPLADAMGFGLIGNWILNGLTYTYTTLTFNLSAGKAILGGRVFFLNQARSFTLSSTAGTYYLCLSQDISKTNSEDSSGVVTNNQFTLQIKASGDMTWGDVVGGDLQSDFALYKIVTDGSKITNVTQITFKYYNSQTVSLNTAQTSQWMSAGTLTYTRIGYQVTIQGSGTQVGNSFDGQSTGYTVLAASVVNNEFRPPQTFHSPAFMGGDYATQFAQNVFVSDGQIVLKYLSSSNNPVTTSNPTHAGVLTFYQSYVASQLMSPKNL